MTQIINQLATIEVSNAVLQQLDIGSIYASFTKNFRKLDELKNFRAEYEKQNFAMRWWHNDKLKDAQLDSAEVQAEFSKTIGQLMMISIMQSKHLTEQQALLNEQQHKLKSQANDIAKQTDRLQTQHHTLAEQSDKLKKLTEEYFELQGLTEEGAEKLIEIANEVKSTKNQLLQEFSISTKNIKEICDEVKTDIGKLTQNQSIVETRLQSEHSALESKILEQAETHQQQLTEHQKELRAIDRVIKIVSAQSSELVGVLANTQAGLTSRIEQQQNSMAIFKQEVSASLKRLRLFSTGISVTVAIGFLGLMAYLMK